MKEHCFYFDSSSNEKSHTARVLELIKETALAKDIKDIIIPTTHGLTGLQAVDHFKGSDLNLVIVTHQTGFRERGQQEVPQDVLNKLKNSNAKILTCQHAFAGIDRAVRFKFGTYEISELIAMALRTFGQGTKVCAEVTLMTADAGLISMESSVIACGGTNHGLDTSWIIEPAHSHHFFDLKFKQLICKPSTF
ncbi:MAG: pyruvate kinase alpha/beta domain-containing protein [Candidatus Hodarchaeales archaeon]